MPVELKYKKIRIRVFAPATVANVGSGFDIFGFALNTPGDELRLQVTSRPGVRISRITGEGGQLPLAAEKNTAGGSILAMLQVTFLASDGIIQKCHRVEGPQRRGQRFCLIHPEKAFGGQVLTFANEGENASAQRTSGYAAACMARFILVAQRKLLISFIHLGSVLMVIIRIEKISMSRRGGTNR
jgi:hypothetical protein